MNAPLILVLGRVSQVLVSVMSVKAMTALLTPLEVGRLYLLLALVGGVNRTFLTGPSHFMQRHFLEYRRQGLSGATVTCTGLIYTAIAVVGMFMAGGAILAGLVESQRVALVALAIGAVIFGGITAQCAAILNLIDRRLGSVALILLSTLLALAFSLLLAVDNPTAEYWLLGQAVGQLGVAFLAIFLVRRRLGLHGCLSSDELRMIATIRRDDIKGAVAFTWPLMVIVFLFWFFNQGYRFCVEAVLGAETLGYFVVAYAIGAMMVTSAETVMNQWVTPMFYRRIVNATPEAATELWRAFFAPILGLYLPVMAFAIGAAPLLLQFLTSGNFRAAANLACWGGLVESMRVLAGLIYQSGMGQKDTRRMILPHVVGAVLAMLGVFFLPGWIGLSGIGLGLLLAYIALAIGLWRVVDPAIMSRLTPRYWLIPAVGAVLVGVILAIGNAQGATTRPALAIVFCAGGGTALALTLLAQGQCLKWNLEPEPGL